MRTLAAFFLASALAGCSDAPSKSDCEKLLEHLIEIEIKAGGGDGELSAEMKDDLEKQKKQVVEFATGQKFIETCTEKTPKKVVQCALAAPTPAEVAKCDDGK